ncbi:hypothetical protein B0H11DRAFT_1921558 [Mycena galericulata]|nr:hypothetical protein B0H11DRAFT_1921558 [Mycena galericulata]
MSFSIQSWCFLAILTLALNPYIHPANAAPQATDTTSPTSSILATGQNSPSSPMSSASAISSTSTTVGFRNRSIIIAPNMPDGPLALRAGVNLPLTPVLSDRLPPLNQYMQHGPEAVSLGNASQKKSLIKLVRIPSGQLAVKPGPGLRPGLGALSEGLGLVLGNLKAKPGQAGPKPGLPGQTGFSSHL